MWASVITAIVAALAGAVTDWLAGRKRDADLIEQGRTESLKERIELNVKVNEDIRRLRHRLRTDPDFRARVRDSFTTGAGSD